MTAQQLVANVRTNLVFYRRNRVMVLVSIVFALTLGISIITVASTASKRFDLAQNLVSTLEGFFFVFSAFLGLMTVSHQIRSRSVKLVLTRPCSLGAWVVSHLVTAVLLIVLLHLFLVLGAVVLFSIWQLPFQWGLVVNVALNACSCLIVFSFLLLLSTLMHPVVAAVVAMLFSPSSVHSLLTMLQFPRQSHAAGGISRFLYDALSWVLTGFYYSLPEYFPFSHDLARMGESWRVTRFDLLYVVLGSLYTPIVTTLCVLLTIVVLYRKRLI